MVAVVIAALLAGVAPSRGASPPPSATGEAPRAREVAARFAAALHAEADGSFSGSWRLAAETTVRDAAGRGLHTLARVTDVERGRDGRREQVVRVLEDGRDVTAHGARRPSCTPARRARRAALAARFPAPGDVELAAARPHGTVVVADFRSRPGAATEVVAGTLAWDRATFAPRWAELLLAPAHGLEQLRVRLDYDSTAGVDRVRRVRATARETRRLFARSLEVDIALSRVRPHDDTLLAAGAGWAAP